jgi:uncharacterized protein YciI
MKRRCLMGEVTMNNSHNNETRFIFFYFNRNEPEKIRRVVPVHVQYWKNANLTEYRGGPFRDRTGGLISFAAQSLQEARDFALQDPFILEDLVAEMWIKEWVLE